MPTRIVANLADHLQALADKYAVTFAATVQNIAKAEQALHCLLPQLQGKAHDMQAINELTKSFEL